MIPADDITTRCDRCKRFAYTCCGLGWFDGLKFLCLYCLPLFTKERHEKAPMGRLF